MKNHVLISALIIVMTVVVTASVAQQTDPAPAKPDSGKETSPGSVKQKVEPAIRFTPSEKIRADDAVSFPVDI
jgi:hypothetical protein